jgi:hypothetical protein
VTVYKKNQMGHKIMAYKEQLTNLVYQKSWTKISPGVYGEYAKQWEKYYN